VLCITGLGKIQRGEAMLVSGLVMIWIGALFIYSYLNENKNFLCRWIMLFSTRVHILPSARGKRYWAIFYGMLAFIWGIGGIIWSLFS
jgi:hypothetical protein